MSSEFKWTWPLPPHGWSHVNIYFKHMAANCTWLCVCVCVCVCVYVCVLVLYSAGMGGRAVQACVEPFGTEHVQRRLPWESVRQPTPPLTHTHTQAAHTHTHKKTCKSTNPEINMKIKSGRNKKCQSSQASHRVQTVFYINRNTRKQQMRRLLLKEDSMPNKCNKGVLLTNEATTHLQRAQNCTE